MQIININGADYVKPIQLAKEAGVPPQYVYQLIQQGKIAVELYINQKFIPAAAAADWLKKRQSKTMTTADLVANMSEAEKAELRKLLK